MILICSILIFLAVTLLLGGLALNRSGASGRAIVQRLRRLGRDPGPVVEAERDTRLSTMPWLDRLLRRLDLGRHLELLLYQAGSSMRAGVLVLALAAFAMTGWFLGVSLFHRVFPALVFLMVLGPLPYLFVLVQKHRRMRAFAREFPDALDLLVSGLRAGLSFPAAMQILAEESPEPIRSEFAIAVEEQSLGLEFRDVMVNLCRRVPLIDLRFFATAVLLQRETGGNLAEVLSNTADMIRERFRVLGDISTFTAQGKLTGVILVCLPIAVGAFTAIMTPDYFRPMVETAGGRTALVTAGAMQLMGVLAIARIVRIRV
jgi:tight adherence protein B